jgi:hypothetical protein
MQRLEKRGGAGFRGRWHELLLSCCKHCMREERRELRSGQMMWWCFDPDFDPEIRYLSPELIFLNQFACNLLAWSRVEFGPVSPMQARRHLHAPRRQAQLGSSRQGSKLKGDVAQGRSLGGQGPQNSALAIFLNWPKKTMVHI